jgi:hypothetical protein
MNIKFNWGTGILITIILFVGIMVSIIVFSMNQQVNLVSPDYYPKGIDYDKQIEKSKNLNALKEKVSYQKLIDSLVVIFPKEFDSKAISGTIQFYYMTNFEKDIKRNLSLINGSQTFSLNGFTKGRYIIKLDWTDGQKGYYQEIDLNL